MAYIIQAPVDLGLFPLGSISAAGVIPDGMVVGQEAEGRDTTNGYYGRFKLLYGVAATVAGSVVSYDGSTGLTALTAAANTAFPLAVALSANVGPTTLAWYQISGPATIKKTAVQVLPNVKIYLSTATAGRIKVLVSAGLQVIGARTANTTTVTSTTSTVLVSIGAGGAYAQGQIT